MKEIKLYSFFFPNINLNLFFIHLFIFSLASTFSYSSSFLLYCTYLNIILQKNDNDGVVVALLYV